MVDRQLSLHVGKQTRALFAEVNQIAAIGRFGQRLSAGAQLSRIDIAVEEGNLLEAGDLNALPVLDRVHELGRLKQAVVRAGVEPRKAAGQRLDRKVASFQIGAVDV